MRGIGIWESGEKEGDYLRSGGGKCGAGIRKGEEGGRVWAGKERGWGDTK